MVMFMTVAKPSEYLAVTGQGIDDIKLAKKAWVLPGQRCTVFDVTPVNYEFNVQAMSAEKLPFILPAVFTIGPCVDDMGSLMKYARLLSSHDKLSNHVRDLVLGVIEGETRVIAASLTMEDIFRGTKHFKQHVFESVQVELDQFGLLIYNANVKQLVDVPGHEYFSYLGQKMHEEASNQAKVDVSEARMKGDVGAKQRQGLTLQNAAKVDAETKIYCYRWKGEREVEEVKVRTELKVFENKKDAEVAAADAELAVEKAGWARQVQMAEVEASKAVALREAELQMEVERRNAMRQTEKLKGELLSGATVNYEMKVQEANWELYKRQKEAEACLYQQEKQAESHRAAAEAALFAHQQEANGELYSKKNEAEGIMAFAQAEGVYLRTLLAPLGGNYMALRDHMMIQCGLYGDIAKANAEALQGLQPKINVWTNGKGAAERAECCGSSSSNSSSTAMEEVAGVYRMLPPLLQTVQEQTGMIPPTWMGALPSTVCKPST